MYSLNKFYTLLQISPMLNTSHKALLRANSPLCFSAFLCRLQQDVNIFVFNPLKTFINLMSKKAVSYLFLWSESLHNINI